MAQTALGGNPVQTSGDLPAVGATAPEFALTGSDLAPVSSADFAGQRVVLNIFPSIDTATCATSVRTFNERASSLENTSVLCVSADLPFAHKRFCGDEGLENVHTLSTFNHPEFGRDYGVEIAGGPFAGLTARAVLVLDGDNRVVHAQMVPEIAEEPDYEAALAALR